MYPRGTRALAGAIRRVVMRQHDDQRGCRGNRQAGGSAYDSVHSQCPGRRQEPRATGGKQKHERDRQQPRPPPCLPK
jgi:hypothetical protein